jgi:phosphatidylserine decarboxylase
MLDSLGSTLSAETVNSFFTRNGKKPVEDELTVDEAIRCLEMQVGRPPNEKKRVVPVEEGGSLLDLSTPGTPGGSGMGMSRSLSTQTPPQLGKLDFSGPPMHLLQDLEVSPDDGALKVPPPAQSAYPTEFSQQPLAEAAAGVGGAAQKTLPSPCPACQSSGTSSDAEDSSGSGSGSNSGSSSEDTFERVINVKNCPICHRPRLNKKAEMDIITHVAVCASGDWAKIDKIVVGNFVTASQAQGKWYTKVILRFLVGIIDLGRCVFFFFFSPLFEFAV